MKRTLRLKLLKPALAVCRLAPRAPLPEWARGKSFCSVTRTATELSIVAPEASVPARVRVKRGFRALEVRGPLEFSQTGVLASLATPLAAAGVSIFVMSTFDTDYLLVRQADLSRAIAALARAGHTVERP